MEQYLVFVAVRNNLVTVEEKRFDVKGSEVIVLSVQFDKIRKLYFTSYYHPPTQDRSSLDLLHNVITRGRDQVWDEKRCSHILQSGHFGGGQRITVQCSFSESRYFRGEKRNRRENISIIEKMISCLFVFPALTVFVLWYWNCKTQATITATCKFLTDNNARWTIDRVYRYFAGRAEYYKS